MSRCWIIRYSICVRVHSARTSRWAGSISSNLVESDPDLAAGGRVVNGIRRGGLDARLFVLLPAFATELPLQPRDML